jgi:hypothetical protein
MLMYHPLPLATAVLEQLPHSGRRLGATTDTPGYTSGKYSLFRGLSNNDDIPLKFS